MPHLAQVQKPCCSRNRTVAYPSIENQPLPLGIRNCTAVDQSWIVIGLFAKIGFLTHAALTSLLDTPCYHHVHSTVFKLSAPEPDTLHSHYTITLHLYRLTLNFILQDICRQKPNQVWSSQHQLSTLPTHTSWPHTYSGTSIYCSRNDHFPACTVRHFWSRTKFHINNVIYFRIHRSLNYRFTALIVCKSRSWRSVSRMDRLKKNWNEVNIICITSLWTINLATQ